MSSSPTETAVAVTMPQMGVSMAEGTIAEWRKQPGDWVEADETVCEVTTDKIDVEIPSPASGRLERILAEPGQTVTVGTAIAEIDAGARPGEAHPDEAHPPETHPHEVHPADAPDAEAEVTPEVPDRSGCYSPVVIRIAEKHGVDLEEVEGTGVGGRVRKKDVLAYVEGEGAAEERPLHTESPYRPEPGAARAAGTAPAPPGEERREPLTPMRQAIARH